MNLIVCQRLCKYPIHVLMLQTYAGEQFGWF